MENITHSIMESSIQMELSNRELKVYYKQLFENCKSHETKENFMNYLVTICKELIGDLNIDLELLKKDMQDDVLCSVRRFGAIESVKRCLKELAEASNYKTVFHPDWIVYAGRLEIQRLKLIVPETLEEELDLLEEIWNKDELDYYSFCKQNIKELEHMLHEKRYNDYKLTYFGIRTLEKSYLMKYIENDVEKIVETPQRLYLRVAAFLFMPDIDKVREYYYLLSDGYYTHASPTLFNSGVKKGSLSSCFLLSLEDNLEHIFKQLSNCAMISKATGGIGLDITNIRHSQIGHNGKSSGIVPMLQVYNNALRYVDQTGKRKGSATVFLQPWHVDIIDFLYLKRQHGKEEMRARDLFYCVWMCDLFMKRVKNNETWSLFCPKKAPMLTNTYGTEFERYYIEYEKNGVYSEQVPARQIMHLIIETQIETGMPFIAHKDTINKTNNQKNLGLIRSSNLCMEIVEVTDGEQIASCNLASIALDEYVEYDSTNKAYYNFEKLGKITRMVVRALNRVIDRTVYPLVKYDENGKEINDGPIKKPNMKYRPLGIGVQALADTFMKLNIAWESDEARELNKHIFATIYYYAMLESIDMAKETGSYIGFDGSPASRGILKVDMIAKERARKQLYMNGIVDTDDNYTEMLNSLAYDIFDKHVSKMYNWEELRQNVKRHGMKNSLLVALMPTASSAQIRYKTEAFEPMTCNLYVRSVLSGNHIIINRFMVRELESMGLWNKSVMNLILKNKGSIQHLPDALANDDPDKLKQLQRLKELCKTAFEIKQKHLVDLSIDRSFYVCQSQSLNIFMNDPSPDQLLSMHFYAWQNGLSTGMYYLRTSPATEAIQFTVDGEIDLKQSVVCTDEVCISCST